jgi:adenylate cyclase
VAVEGFKRKITAILSADDDGYSRLMYDPEEPTSHKLTSYSTSKTDIGMTGSTSVIGQLDVIKGDT